MITHKARWLLVGLVWLALTPALAFGQSAEFLKTNNKALELFFHLGGAENVEAGDHSCRTRLTAVSASEAVMSGRARWTARTASSVWPKWSLPAAWASARAWRMTFSRSGSMAV